MKNTLITIALLASSIAYAAPAPYPLTINSQAQTAPPVTVYRGSESSFLVTFTDGNTASDVTGCTPFFVWATNSVATGVSTSSWSIVTATNGTVNFHFTPAAVNFPAGRYIYEIGVKSNDLPRVYRQGIFQILASPMGSGAGAIENTLPPIDWTQITWLNLPDWSTASEVADLSTFLYSRTITINGASQLLTNNPAFTIEGTEGSGISASTATNISVFVTARDAVANAATNGWETGAHSDWLIRYAYDYTYTTNAGEVTITGYTGADTYLTIPAFINGLPVTTLGANAFNGLTLTGVFIPEGVRSIEADCFRNATFATITIPSTVTNLAASSLLSSTTLKSVVFKGNAPPDLTPYGLSGQQTNYVATATATGWGATYGIRPVVRMAVAGDGTALTGVRVQRVYSPSSYNYWLDGDGVFWFYNVAFLTTSVVDRVTFQTAFNASNDVWRSYAPGAALGATAMQPADGATLTNGVLYASAIPGAGCTDLGATNGPTITGATVSYGAAPTTAYTLSVSATATRYCYAIEILSTNACTLGTGLNLRGTWTPTGTNIVTLVPCTGTLWRVYGRGL